MLRGLYTAYTGMEAQQEKMDVVSNNLANASTKGFKQDNVVFKSFSDVLATKINDPEYKGQENIGKMTLGVQVDNVYTNFEQGALELTESPYDLSIEGPGMMTIGSFKDDGSVTELFTRDGSLTVNQKGQLVTKDGYYVIGEQGKINIGSGDLSITSNGTVYVDNQRVDKITMTGFDNFAAISKVGDNNYTQTDRTEKTDFEGMVRQGYLETSNVNSVKEMINMINLQRIYEANQKVLKTYDDTLDKAVNSVGRV